MPSLLGQVLAQELMRRAAYSDVTRLGTTTSASTSAKIVERAGSPNTALAEVMGVLMTYRPDTAQSIIAQRSLTLEEQQQLHEWLEGDLDPSINYGALLHVLNESNPHSDADAFERFLYSDELAAVRASLIILVNENKPSSQIAQALLFYINGSPNDELGFIQDLAISLAGMYLRSNPNKQLATALYEIATGSRDVQASQRDIEEWGHEPEYWRNNQAEARDLATDAIALSLFGWTLKLVNPQIDTDVLLKRFEERFLR